MTFEDFLIDKHQLNKNLESPKRFSFRDINEMVKQYESLKNEELKKRIKDMKHNQE